MQAQHSHRIQSQRSVAHEINQPDSQRAEAACVLVITCVTLLSSRKGGNLEGPCFHLPLRASRRSRSISVKASMRVASPESTRFAASTLSVGIAREANVE